jgi:hypothetical protein
MVFRLSSSVSIPIRIQSSFRASDHQRGHSLARFSHKTSERKELSVSVTTAWSELTMFEI